MHFIQARLNLFSNAPVVPFNLLAAIFIRKVVEKWKLPHSLWLFMTTSKIKPLYWIYYIICMFVSFSTCFRFDTLKFESCLFSQFIKTPRQICFKKGDNSFSFPDCTVKCRLHLFMQNYKMGIIVHWLYNSLRNFFRGEQTVKMKLL